VRKVSSPGPSDGRPTLRKDGVSQRGRILYVEDDDENWDVAEYRLGHEFEVLRASNSLQACEALRRHGPALVAILMDIELRGSDLNGIELTELFRGKRLEIRLPSYAEKLPTFTRPIIFVTAHGARYTDVELMLFGADRVIAKPVDFAELTAALGSSAMPRPPRGR
jgi:CheY-like chemotaxis protein